VSLSLPILLVLPAASPVEYATSYDPDFQEHQKALRQFEKLPDGFPLKIIGPEAWKPCELKNSYIFHLSEAHCAEIASACEEFIGSGQNMSLINQTTVPLPLLSNELDRRRRQLHTGCGLALFRGLDPERFTRQENVVIFAGLSAHMFQKRGYQAAGKILGTEMKICLLPFCLLPASELKNMSHY